MAIDGAVELAQLSNFLETFENNSDIRLVVTSAPISISICSWFLVPSWSACKISFSAWVFSVDIPILRPQISINFYDNGDLLYCDFIRHLLLKYDREAKPLPLQWTLDFPIWSP